MADKIKDTKVGEWLSNKAPKILDMAGDLLPDAGVLGVVKRLVDGDPEISAQDKLEYEKLQGELEATRQQEVTKRWEADMSSDVKLAKVIRPSVMIALLLFFMALTLWDAISENFMPRDSFIDLLQVLMLTVFGAYFAGRTIEKSRK
jgi:hypothetical protein